MTIKDHLMEQYKSNHGAVRRALDDIGDQESLERGGHKINHIRWNAAHLASAAGLMLRIMGGKEEFPENWHTLFARGAEFHEDPSVYPSMDLIRDKLYGTYEKMYSALEKMTVDDLETAKEIVPEWNTTPAEALLFLCRHEFYHLGQIATLRTILGKERLFG